VNLSAVTGELNKVNILANALTCLVTGS